MLASARLDDNELIARIERTISNLKAVNTPTSLNLADMGELNLAKAKDTWARVDRTAALKQLWLCLSLVELGWV